MEPEHPCLSCEHKGIDWAPDRPFPANCELKPPRVILPDGRPEWCPLLKKMYEWQQLDHYPKENAPHVATTPTKTLCLQPMYGDGRYYTASVKTETWVLALRERFRDLDEAKRACEKWADCMPD
jgi:hypothetical protein